jgi:hypothetical protein
MENDHTYSTFYNIMPNFSNNLTSQLNDLQFLASVASDQNSIPTQQERSTVPSFEDASVIGKLSQSEPQPKPRKIHELFSPLCRSSSHVFREARTRAIDNPVAHSHSFQRTSTNKELLRTIHPVSNTRASSGHTRSHKDDHRNSTGHLFSYTSNQKDFLIFIYVLLKILRKKHSGNGLLQKAKMIVQECLSCHRAGVAGYSPLMEVIDNRLRAVDGMAIQIRRTEGYFTRYLQKKGVSGLEPVVKL